MNKIKEIFLRYPTRSRYLLLIMDIFLVLVASKMFINYSNIKQTIEETALEGENKKLELAFTENFLIPYEKSEYSEYFLKHENNILMPKEFIVKFQTITPQENTGQLQAIPTASTSAKTPQESRKNFFYQKLYDKKE